MIILESIDELRRWRSDLPGTLSVGFTPTMGALHDGHLEHLRLLAPAVDVRICSIFVNPAQFAAGEDLAKYPRDLKQDSDWHDPSEQAEHKRERHLRLIPTDQTPDAA